MDFFGDVFLTEGEIGGNIQYQNGQPILDGGLETFIYISLFSTDYWGNEIVNNDAEILESGLDDLLNSKVTSQLRIALIDRINNLLQPAIDIGLADEILVEIFLKISIINIEIEVVANSSRLSNIWTSENLFTIG